MPSTTSDRPGPNNTFGKYRLIASLGAGGMADVFLAVSSGPARVTKLQVIKRLRRNLAEEPEYLAMFLDEARLAARLNHPNVVQTIEVGNEGQDYFIAMEYLDGQPLNRILHAAKTKPAPKGFALQIVAEALAGLHYAHELRDYDGTPLNIVHRDTSPHNIFVTYEGQTKLVDFGIAKASRRTSETSYGVVKGKFTYMSPEQAMMTNVDRRSDVFVMGVVLWESLAGQRMWKGLDEVEIAKKLIPGEIPKLVEMVPDAPAELVRICDKALAYKPEDRYATAGAMRKDILAYMNAERIQITAEDISEYLMAAFAERSAELKKVIEKQLRRLDNSEDVTAVSAPTSSSVVDLPEIGSGPRNLDHTPSKSAGNTQTPMAAALPDASVVPPPSKMNNKTRALIAVGALAVVGVIGYAALGKKKPPASAAVIAPTSAATIVPTAEPTVTGGVELKIQAEPKSARILLDDAELPGNPYTGRFRADGFAHRLRVEASGYSPHTEMIVFEKDADVNVTLATATPTATAESKSKPTVVTPRAAAAAPAPPPAATTSTPAATAAPASKGGRTLEDPWATGTATNGTPKRGLDSSDPFH